MARPGATHRAAAPSCTPATRDRTGRLHRDVHGRPAACRNPGRLDESGLASASRPRIARGRRHPAGSPAIPEPGPRARRHPGVPAGLPFTPCAVTLDRLHARGTVPVRQARRTGTPAHHGNPVRPCRRQIRTSANRTVCVAACRSTVSPGALSARGRGSMSSAAFTHSSSMPGTQGLGRGPVRGPGRRIIPAPRVPSVRSPVLSVQLARAQPRRVPLVMRRSSVRFR